MFEKLSGLKSFERFTDDCLMHPRWGYYNRRVKFGAKAAGGDFWTYPMILAPYFGQRIADRAYGMWRGMLEAGATKPSRPFTVAEIGGGCGHFARDFLDRTAQRYPDLYGVIRYRVSERSKKLRLTQLQALRGHRQRVEIRPEDLSQAPGDPMTGLVFANDALSATAVHKIRLARDEPPKVTLVKRTWRGTFREVYVDARKHPEVMSYLGMNEHLIRDAWARTKHDVAFIYVNTRAESFIWRTGKALEGGYVLLVDSFRDTQTILGNALNFGPYLNDRSVGWPQFKTIRGEEVSPWPYDRPGTFDIAVIQDHEHLTRVGEQAGLRRIHFCHQGCLFAQTDPDEIDIDVVVQNLLGGGWPEATVERSARELTTAFFQDGGFSTYVGGFHMMLLQKSGTDPRYRWFSASDTLEETAHA